MEPALTQAGPAPGPSLWQDTLPAEEWAPRNQLDGDTEVDVCIVGAGYTGLWTAYYLLRQDPQLRVLVVEARTVGFGASGRNGGWCSALFPASTAALARRHGRAAALAMRRAMHGAVVEIGAVAAAEGIDCHYRRGGTVGLVRTPVQLRRAREEAALDTAFDGIDEIALLDAAQARERVGATGVLGATYTPHCARVHPARLVHGLARAVERRGGRIVEGTPVLRIEAEAGARRPSAHTPHGTVHADHVIRATEAWTAQLPGTSRAVIPVYSLMVATEPLPAPVWQQLGLHRGETFNDHRHLIIYGQRTADDRLVFGGRGAPYHFGSRIDPAFDADERVFTALRATVRELFPVIAPNQFSHAWGGPLGISRDWHAGVGLDRTTGLGWAGGYVGDGVGTANLAGRTLAALITGTDPDGVTRLPWVGHRSRPWEPEPLRWLEVNAGLRVMTAADREERLTGRPSVLARVMSRLLGH